MAYQYFASYSNFRKRDKNLFFDFEEIKARKVIEEKRVLFFTFTPVRLNSARSIYFKRNVKGDSSYLAKNVLIKNISNLNKQGFKNALNYVIRHSADSFCIDSENHKLTTREVLEKWKDDFSVNENGKDVWHLVFSIKEQNSLRNKENLLNAVKETMDKNFFGYDFVMVAHSHQNNPHIHVLVNKRNAFTLKKMHFKNRDEIRFFFNGLRNDFASSLNARGYNYKNTMKLEQDLQQKFTQLESLESRSALIENLEKQQDSLQKKLNNCNQKSRELKEIFTSLYKEKMLLLQEAFEAQSRNDKVYFKKFKEIKKINEKIKDTRETLKTINTEGKMLYKDLIRLDNYRELQVQKSREDYFSLQEKKKYIELLEKSALKHLSKQQILLLKQFKKEVFLKERELNAEQTNLIKNSFAINQLFCGSVNAFVLEKKKKDLLSLSKLALLGELELETLDLINKNSAFIDSCMRNRYKILEKNLANKDKISLFAYKEMELLSKRLKLNNDEFLRELSLKVINGDSKRKRKSNTKDFQTHSSNSKSKNSKSNFKDFTPNSEKARSFSSPR